MKTPAKVIEEMDFFYIAMCYAALLLFGKLHL